MDPLCMFYESYSELVMWTLFASLMTNIQSWSCEKCSEFVMCTLDACLLKYIKSWSCGPSMHV